MKLIVAGGSDSETDLLVRTLSASGFRPDTRRVGANDELLRVLDEGDAGALFVYDDSEIDPLMAATQVRERGSFIPLIVVSKPLGGDAAVRLLKAGVDNILQRERFQEAGALLEKEMEHARKRAERRRIEKAVQTVANEWRTAVDTVRSPICLVDPTGKLVRCNKAFQRLSGRPFTEIIGGDLGIILNTVDRSYDHGAMKNQTIFDGRRIHLARLDGRTFEVQVEPVIDAAGNPSGFVHVMNDVTERLRAEEGARRMEKHLAETQKMEAVGQLAGGIAHDFNNILTGIMGYCNVLLMRLHSENALSPFVSKIMSAAERAVLLTQGLLTFGRRQPVNPRPADLNSLVSANKEFMGRVIGEEIEIRFEPCPHALPVYVDAVQFEQILLNLSSNARDAMLKGGLITVRTSADGPEVPRPFAYLVFSDTGAGIEEEAMKRIFEPFFTTKEIGKGTGLGLSVVWSIVEQNGGRISVESAVGKGTVFTIALPLLKGKTEAADAGAEKAGIGGTETILLVEDDDTVRDMARAVLEGVGYTVIPAADYNAAISLFDGNRERISLAILDVVMPKRDGRVMFEEMRARNPGLKSLFISGYAGDVLGMKGVDSGSRGFLKKPFSPVELVSRVREILDS